jgi:hypothetical protein
VTVTFGNTKSVDLLVHKDDEVFAVQVKGIQHTKSICWNLDKTKVIGKKKIIIVLANLHCTDKKAKPEFFVLTLDEAVALFKDTPKEGQKRTYLDYKWVKSEGEKYQDRWQVFDQKEKQLFSCCR